MSIVRKRLLVVFMGCAWTAALWTFIEWVIAEAMGPAMSGPEIVRLYLSIAAAMLWTAWFFRWGAS